MTAGSSSCRQLSVVTVSFISPKPGPELSQGASGFCNGALRPNRPRPGRRIGTRLQRIMDPAAGLLAARQRVDDLQIGGFETAQLLIRDITFEDTGRDLPFPDRIAPLIACGTAGLACMADSNRTPIRIARIAPPSPAAAMQNRAARMGTSGDLPRWARRRAIPQTGY